MKHKHHTIHRLVNLLQPSWLSGMISVAVPLLLIGIVAVVTRLQGPILQGDLLLAHHATAGIPSSYLIFAKWIDQNQYTRNLPFVMFWVATGLAIYMFVLQLLKMFNSVVDLEHEMHYIHSRPMQSILDAFTRLLVRLLAAICLTAILLYVLNHLVPDCVALTRAVALHATIGEVGLLGVIGLSLTVGIWIQTVLLRLLFLRLRLFSELLD